MSYNLMDILEELSAISGTNDKLEALMKYKDFDDLRDYLKLAIDDRIRFNVDELPEIELIPGGCTFSTFKELTFKLYMKALTGNAARDEIIDILEHCTGREFKWFSRCIRKDTAQLGIGRKLTNKVWPNLVLDFKVSLASPEEELEKFNWEGGAVLELKLNGVRTIIVIRNGRLDGVYGRSGLPIKNFEYFGKLIEGYMQKIGSIRSFVLDGEVHVDNSLEDTMSLFGFDFSKTEEDFKGASGKVGAGWKKYCAREGEVFALRDKAVYSVFDYLNIDEWDMLQGKVPYEARWAKTCNFVDEMKEAELDQWFVLPDHAEVKDLLEAVDMAKAYIAKGLEGGILKNKKHLYSFKRDRNWIKIKEEVETDVKVLAIHKGEPKYNSDGSPKPDMMGKFTVIDQGGRTYDIGTGKYLSEDRRVHIWNNQSEYIGKIFYVTAQRFTEDAAICPRIEYDRPDKTELD